MERYIKFPCVICLRQRLPKFAIPEAEVVLWHSLSPLRRTTNGARRLFPVPSPFRLKKLFWIHITHRNAIHYIRNIIYYRTITHRFEFTYKIAMLSARSVFSFVFSFVLSHVISFSIMHKKNEVATKDRCSWPCILVVSLHPLNKSRRMAQTMEIDVRYSLSQSLYPRQSLIKCVRTVSDKWISNTSMGARTGF